MNKKNPYLSSLLDHLFDSIVVLNREAEIIYYNNHFSNLTRTSPRILDKTRHLGELLKSDETDFASLVSQSVSNCLQKGENVLTREISLQLVRDEKVNFDVVLKFIPITLDKDKDKDKFALVCINDLSVEKHLHRKYRSQLAEIKSGHEQVLQLEKLATMGELAAEVAHEVNNPLAIASGYLEILRSKFEEEEILKEKENIVKYLGNVNGSLEKIKRIIINMKNFVHRNEDQKAYCRIDEVIENVFLLLAPAFAKEKVELIRENRNPKIIGHVNKIKMEQVLVNICKNALDSLIDSRTKEGRITVGIHSDTENGLVQIIVRDNGPGIPNDLKDKIFRPFFTTKDVGKGTGLGLSVAQKIMEMHNGGLRINEDKMDGAEFIIEFPSIEVSSFSYTMNQIGKLHSGDRTGKRILVVDNEVEVLNILQQFFEEEDLEFVGSTNAQDALKFLQEIVIDLIITDIKMPDMDGSEFISHVRNEGIHCPVLYLSTVQNQNLFFEDRERLRISGFISKPFSKSEIIQAIRHILDNMANPSMKA